MCEDVCTESNWTESDNFIPENNEIKYSMHKFKLKVITKFKERKIVIVIIKEKVILKRKNEIDLPERWGFSFWVRKVSNEKVRFFSDESIEQENFKFAS